MDTRYQGVEEWVRKGIRPFCKVFYSVRAHVLNKMVLFDWKGFVSHGRNASGE